MNMSRQYKPGDLVTITVTGMVEEVTESGYVVNVHGTSVPMLHAQEENEYDPTTKETISNR